MQKPDSIELYDLDDSDFAIVWPRGGGLELCCSDEDYSVIRKVKYCPPSPDSISVV